MRRTTIFGVGVAALIFSIAAAATMASAVSGQTTRVSVNSAGVAANLSAVSGVLSADGRYVVFQSSATDLVPGVTTGTHVYRFDRTNRATVLVDIATTGLVSTGSALQPTVSGDGQYVAFVSAATDLVSGDTNGMQDVFVRDMSSTSVKLVSVTPLGQQANGLSSLSGLSGAHEISDDGRYVVFTSLATNLAGTNSGVQHVYRKDLNSPFGLELVSVNSAEEPANNSSFTPAISGNGLFVAFTSAATNLSSSTTGQVYVRDFAAGTTTLESPGAANVGIVSTAPVLSDDGRYLAFVTAAHLDPRDADNGNTDVFLRDRTAGTTVAASPSLNSASGVPTTAPSISGDGRVVAFQSLDDMLVSADVGGWIDIFVYDVGSQTFTIASRNDADAQANTHSVGPSLSRDGHLVLFGSTATNLVSDPAIPGVNQLYVRNLVANQAPVLQPVGPVSLLEAQPLHLTWRFTDDDSSTSWSATVDYGDGAGKDTLALAPDKTFVLDHLYMPGPHDVRVEVTDDALAMGSVSIHVEVANVGPQVSLPSTLDLGFARTLDLAGTFRDPGSNETYSATVNYGDGTGTQSLPLGPYVAPTGSFTLHHTYASAGTYNVAVTVSDGRGGSSTANMQVSIRPNQAPVLPPFGKDIPLFEAQPLRLTWEFRDNDGSTSWTGTVDYGDGSGVQTLTLSADKTFFLDHLYVPGAYDLTVQITDDENATGRLVIHVVVSNIAPFVNLLPTLDLAFSRTLDTFGTFIDPGSNETYSATVDYGDGTGSLPLALGPYSAPPYVGGSFTLHHTYATAGTYNVVVTVSDGRGGSRAATLVAKVGGYSYEFLDPASTFVVGRNLPVKFTVRGPDGSPYFDATVQVDVVDDLDNVVAGPYKFGDQPSRAVTWNGDYHVNIDTRSLAPGMYWLRVQFSSPTLTGEFRLGTTGTGGAGSATKQRTLR